MITATRSSCAQTGKSVLGNIPTCRALIIILHRVALFAPEVKLARDAGTRFVCPARRVKTSGILLCAMPATAFGAKAVAPLPNMAIVQMTNATPHCAMTAMNEDPRTAALATTYSVKSAVRTAKNATNVSASRAMTGGTNAPLTGNLRRHMYTNRFPTNRKEFVYGLYVDSLYVLTLRSTGSVALRV